MGGLTIGEFMKMTGCTCEVIDITSLGDHGRKTLQIPADGCPVHGQPQCAHCGAAAAQHGWNAENGRVPLCENCYKNVPIKEIIGQKRPPAAEPQPEPLPDFAPLRERLR